MPMENKQHFIKLTEQLMQKSVEDKEYILLNGTAFFAMFIISVIEKDKEFQAQIERCLDDMHKRCEALEIDLAGEGKNGE